MNARPEGPPSRRLLHWVLQPFQEFAATGALGGVALLACTVVALVWANSPWADSYFSLWESSVQLGLSDAALPRTLHHWINDGLMAVFFLLVGLEIKRELLVGELASVRKAMLPITAAIGGMIVPACIYALINRGGDGAAGWGVPMATDIAFALGVLALLGPRVPVGLKVFLAAFAIADDMGAVLVIAIFYTTSLSWLALTIAAVILALMLGLNALRVVALPPYLLLGVALWLALLSSGVHATIAGVVLAFAIPATGSSADEGPLLKLEHALHGTVAFVIMPIFALANAGVRLDAITKFAASPIAIGIAIGLLAGKPIGITLCSWLSVRFLGASLPTGVTMRMIHAVSWIGGIGFTMSLFVAGLAFGESERLNAAKIGILGGSIVAGVTGYMLLRSGSRATAATPATSPQ